MNDEKEHNVESCPHCGAKTQPHNPYCPKCGRLVFKGSESPSSKRIKKRKESKIRVKDGKYQRICPGCGSIINSNVLEQCPICNTRLEPVPESVKSQPKQPGLIFTDKKKLELEENLRVKKDKWNLKEGYNAFGNSILIYITVNLLLFILLSFTLTPEDPLQTTFALDMTSILLIQLPEVFFGLYPILYILFHKHHLSKIGLHSSSKKLTNALIIGIIGGLALVLVNYLNEFVLDLFFASGFDIFGLESYLNETYRVIQNADAVMILLLVILLGLGAISTEFVFRGVLHNTLNEKFGRTWVVIVLTALIYAALYALFSIPLGLVFFVVNFISFLLLGMLYEYNGNLYNTIIASVLYNIIIVLSMVLL
ncbi:MAG: CPBP family glutamic-type intramembrane protease [Promethearchaeia archaeon]